MNKFSENSERRKKTCTENIQKVIDRAIKRCPIDFGISCGHRDSEKQFELFKRGRRFVNGKWIIFDKRKIITYKDGKIKKSEHNKFPSKAIDIFAYIPNKPELAYNIRHLSFIAGFILCIADEMFYKGEISKRIIWGGNSFGNFIDAPHFQEIN